MNEFDRVFIVHHDYRILVCLQCRFAVVPSQIEQHLRSQHPRLTAQSRLDIVSKVRSLSELAQAESDVVYPASTDAPVAGLPVYHDGLRCTAGDRQDKQCPYVCRTPRGIREHCKKEHAWVNDQKRGGNTRWKKVHSDNKLWLCDRACQRFFKHPAWTRYFEVHAEAEESRRQERGQQREEFFRLQQEDISQAQRDATEDNNLVRGFDEHRSTVVPWLRETGIVEHVYGLKKDEIRTAIALPTRGKEQTLQIILDRLEEMLHEAHGRCFDGPACMLTWPCRVVLSKFQSPHVEALGKTRAFDPYKEPETLKAYFKQAKRLLAYFARVAASGDHHFTAQSEEGGRRPEDVMGLTEEQTHTWENICRLAEGRTPRQTEETEEPCGEGESEDARDRSTELKDELVHMLMLLVCHETGARRYRSPILSFCAMLSIKASTSGWMKPGDFNSHLSALIWVVQLVIFYDCARKQLRGEGETLQLVKRCCERYLQQTVETPMGEVLRWRLLLFSISKETVVDHQATWDEMEEVLTFEGTELSLDQIPTLLVSEYSDCRRLLYDDMMFGLAGFPRMLPWALKDNNSVETTGWNFTHERDNAQILHGCSLALLSTIQRSDRLCRLFLSQSGRSKGGISWRESAVASYEETVQQFLKRLCTLVHITGGQPVRENEFLSMTWRNTQRRRAIRLLHEKVMIHVKYHKGQQQTGRYKENIRFLAHPIGVLLLDYIVYVLPLRQIFLRNSTPKALLSPFLWEKDGKVWPKSQLTRCLEESSVRACIPRLHVSNWRQMTVAIVKTKFASQIGSFEPDEEDEDGEEMDETIRAMTKQRNHKTHTVNRAYANQTGAAFGNVWDGLVRMGLHASTVWQDFWGVETILKDGKRKTAGEEETRLTKRMAAGIHRPRKPWTADALLQGVRRLYRDRGVQWKTPEQEQALVSMMGWREQVVVVLPTGAGKSLLFMLPGTLPDAGVTVLVVPLIALRVDMVRRVEELAINHLVWAPGERREAGLVIVSVEAACSDDFMEYARGLVRRQRLDRIVIDECHLTVTAAEYRESVVELANIRCLPTQFVYLTATLPPSMQAEFEERNHLLRPTVIRASANRRNIFYTVQKVDPKLGGLLQAVASDVSSAWEDGEMFDRGRDKVILYVRSLSEAKDLSRLLGCDMYTRECGDEEVKKATLARWVKHPERPFVVATTALAEGFDYPHVRLVVNVDEPQSLVVFGQETGRSGRDGRKAYSIVYLPMGWVAQDDGSHAPDITNSLYDRSLWRERDRHAVHRYLRGDQCRRTSLSEYLDAGRHRRWCMPEDVACDVCGAPHQEAIPPPNASKGRRAEEHTGLDVMQQRRLAAQTEIRRYREDLAAVRGSCMLCRARGEPWDHPFATCSQRHTVFHARKRAIGRAKQHGRKWLQEFSACYWCYNPRGICSRVEQAQQGGEQGVCAHRDIVLPLCYGIFSSSDGPTWLKKYFDRRFTSVDALFDWLGEASVFGGEPAIQGVRVAARMLRECCDVEEF